MGQQSQHWWFFIFPNMVHVQMTATMPFVQYWTSCICYKLSCCHKYHKQHWHYSKNPKNSDTRKIAVIVLKFELSWVHKKANSVDPDQSSLIRVYTVFPGLSVRKIRIITVILYINDLQLNQLIILFCIACVSKTSENYNVQHVKGWMLNFLFILGWMLTNLDLVVYRLKYYFINMSNGLKHFMKIIKPLIESKDSKIYFCNKFITCWLNMYLKVLLYYLRSNSLC